MADYQVVQAGMFGDDDRTFAREQKRKRAPKPALPVALPDGPCCGRCAHWRRPDATDGIGECAVSCVVTGRLYGFVGSPPKGAFLGVADAVRDPGIEWEYLRTRGFAEGCRMYQAEGIV